MNALKKDDIIYFEDGTKAIVTQTKELGSGGQGKVYEVDYTDDKNKTAKYAFKLYTEKTCLTEEYKNDIKSLVNAFKTSKLLNASKLKAFTLPIKISDDKETGRFGYLMKKIPDNMVSLKKILSGRVQFTNKIIEAQACYNMVDALSRFQSQHYSFMDINDGSFFFDIDTGEVCICDCDNIIKSNEKRDILFGTPGYKAPELYEKGAVVSLHTDNHSIATLIYKMLMRDDPFVGKNVDVENTSNIKRIYSTNAIFTMHPENKCNRPYDECVEKDWELLSPEFKEEFINTFTNGLTNPELRTKTSTWMGILTTHLHELNDLGSDPEIGDKIIERRPLTPARLLTIFIVDVSNSMRGKKIQDVNNAITMTVENLAKFETDNTGIKIETAILQFSNGSSWVKDAEPVSEYTPIELKESGKYTDFNQACMQLDYRLTKNDLLKYKGAKKPSVIILISDGKQNRTQYEDEIEELRNNINFKDSTRLAIGLDDANGKSDKQMLMDFVNDSNDEHEKDEFVVQLDAAQDKLEQIICDLTTRVSLATIR